MKRIFLLTAFIVLISSLLFTDSGLDSITGSYTGSGAVSSRPYVASILLIIIILGISLYYSRNFIINLIRKKQP